MYDHASHQLTGPIYVSYDVFCVRTLPQSYLQIIRFISIQHNKGNTVKGLNSGNLRGS